MGRLIHSKAVQQYGRIMAILKDIQDLTTGISFAAIGLTIYYAIIQYRKLQKLPPGPWGYPIVGMLYKINKEFHLFLTDYVKLFGKVFSLQMGNSTLVVLSDHKIIKKAFQSKDFSARPRTVLTNLFGGYGVINTDGDLWKSQRRYLLNQKLGMRHWGHGMSQVESRIEHEAARLLDTLHREFNVAAPINPAPLINCAVSNVICSMIMSTRFDHDNKEFQQFMHNFDEGFRLFTQTGALLYLPFVRHFPGVASSVEQLKANRKEMLQFVKKIISEHKQRLDPSNPRDLIDSYLIIIEKMTNDNSNNNIDSDSVKAGKASEDIFHGFDPETQLEQIILDLFSAGVETLKTSLLWSIIYMLHYPHVMKKVQAELDSKLGPNRLPNVKDVSQLVYTKATMYEIMRRSSIVPMGTTHSTERSIEFEGFTIPKNAHVIPLLHAVHMDPEVWDQPEEFRPERFLNEDHTAVHKPEHFMPFGIGQRMCLGDQLAEKEFFLFFSSLLYCFDLQNPEGREKPSLRGVCAATVTPQDFEVMCSPRNVAALKNSSILDPDSDLDESTHLWAQNRTYG